MAKSNASEMLTSLDSLFTTQEQRDEAKRDSVQDRHIALHDPDCRGATQRC